jgi:uncharacterized protein DUF3606
VVSVEGASFTGNATTEDVVRSRTGNKAEAIAFERDLKRSAAMAKKAKTTRGRNQDRARVAGRQEYEVRYEAKKKSTSRAAVKKAVKKVGNSRKKVERALSR